MRTVFDLENNKKQLRELEEVMQKPDFWEDKEKAIQVSQELSRLTAEIKEFDKLKEELLQLKEDNLAGFEKKLGRQELKVFLSGKYDKGNAILSVYSGAGGQDAQDWATILLRMYQRYCAFKGFKTKILHQSFGEGGGPEGRIGTKQATLEITGKYAYGLLKKETGVHRLVRISPFSTQKLRHTSFTLVEVLPEIKAEESEIKIRPEDLRIEFYRASGPGGQYVNKRETSVRIIHLPTGLTVSCQSERLQGENRKRAQELLLSKLYQLRTDKTKKEISKIKNKRVSIEWGNQIRSYVLHPYKLVKDLRTNIETSKVEEVLDGRLDEFIEVETKEQKI